MQVTIKDKLDNKLLGFVEFGELSSELKKYRIYIFNTYVQDNVISQDIRIDSPTNHRNTVKALQKLTRFNSIMINYFKERARKKEKYE